MRLADTYRLSSDGTYAPYLQERLLGPASAQSVPPQVQFRPAGAAGEFTWIGVYLLDVELPEIIAPQQFPRDFSDSDLIYIELRQRPTRAATAG